MSEKPKRKHNAGFTRRSVIVGVLGLIVGAIVGGLAVFNVLRMQNPLKGTSATADAIIAMTLSPFYGEHDPTVPPPNGIPSATFTPTPFHMDPTIIPTLVMPSVTASPISDMPTMIPSSTAFPVRQNPTVPASCYFAWAYNDGAPADYQKLEQVLKANEFAGYELSILAHGEDNNCVDENQNLVSSRFLTMDVSPTVILTVDKVTLAKEAQLAETVETLATLILDTEFSAYVYRMAIHFTDGTKTVRWEMATQDLKQALDKGDSATTLFRNGKLD